ncbi:MAG: sugar ABC transporter ATP-binding protein [Terrimicrobiaceae bacterium]
MVSPADADDGVPDRVIASDPGAPALSLKGIVKSFPGVRALRGVSLEVFPGEVHALLGENGAGKSTLIKVLSGVHSPDEGEMRIRGRVVHFSEPGQAQAQGIATIYQEFSLYPELSVAENIFSGHIPRTLGGFALDWRRAEREAATLLQSLDAADISVRARTGSLSVGNRQRVEIAKALSLKARVLILDEPTAVLTQHDVERLFAIVRNLRSRGAAIIYISHRLDEIFALADRVTVLRDGQWVATQKVEDITEAELIRQMVGRALEEEPIIHDAPARRDGNEGKPPILRASNLSRAPLLSDASLTLHAGEIVGLAGLIGSGRSELAQAIFGTLPPESGVIEVEGRVVTIRNPEDAIRLGIAYVPEDRGRQGLVTAMSVGQNVSMTRLKHLKRGPFLDFNGEKLLAEGYVESLRIKTPNVRETVRNLSGGNQQKIVVAKWLATKPRILIVDEPTRGIDVGARAEIHRLIVALARDEGLAVVVISSDLQEVLRLADRVLVMHEGRITGEFTRAEATQEAVLTAALGNRGAGENTSPPDGP